MRAVLERIRASAWTAAFLRSMWIATALGVLAFIGRAAAAGTTFPAVASAPLELDADASRTSLPPPSSDTPTPTSGDLPAVASAAVRESSSDAGAAAAVALAQARGGARASPEAPVYINHATVDELRRLPGVGPKRAEAILALRQRLGRFHRVEDLLRVKGVGRTTVKRWRPLVRLDSPEAASSADSGASDGGVP